MNFYLKFAKYRTGNICPESGIWQTIDTKTPILISKGESFPHHAGEIVLWEHKESYVPDPVQLQQLKEAV